MTKYILKSLARKLFGRTVGFALELAQENHRHYALCESKREHKPARFRSYL